MRKSMSMGRKAKTVNYQPSRTAMGGPGGRRGGSGIGGGMSGVRGGGGLPARNTDMMYSDMLKRAASRMNQPGFEFPKPRGYNSPEQLQRLRDMIDVTRSAMRGPRALPTGGGGGGRAGGGSVTKVGGTGGAGNRMTKDQPIVRRRSNAAPAQGRMTDTNPASNRTATSPGGRMTNLRATVGRGRADVVPRVAGRSLAQTGASLAGAAKSFARTPEGAAALRKGRIAGIGALAAGGTAYTLGELMGSRPNEQSMAAGDVSARRVSGSGKGADINKTVGRSALGSVRNSGRGSALNLALGYGVDAARRKGGIGAGMKSQQEIKAEMMKSSKFRALSAADQRKVATAFDQWAVGQDRFNPARTAARRRPSDAMRPSAGRSSRLSAGYM